MGMEGICLVALRLTVRHPLFSDHIHAKIVNSAGQQILALSSHFHPYGMVLLSKSGICNEMYDGFVIQICNLMTYPVPGHVPLIWYVHQISGTPPHSTHTTIKRAWHPSALQENRGQSATS